MLNRYVVVSTNNNPDYIFYAPYIEKAWNKLGWGLVIMVTSDVKVEDLKLSNPETKVFVLPDIEGLRKESTAQAGRLYAANYFEEDAILMTSDIDLLPLSDYWNPKENNITVYGHDLTWRSFYPMGYIAMQAKNWMEWMNLTDNTKEDMARDAEEFKHLAFAPDWESWWNYDWTLVTARLKDTERDIVFVDRGQINIAGTTLAKGRVDRYNWIATMDQPDWIDAHCHNNNVFHPHKMKDFLTVFEKVYGKL